MKMILTIGYQEYIVPDAVNAVKLYETLAKLRPCTDRSYVRSSAVIQVAAKMTNLDLRSIPADAKLVNVKASPELTPLEEESEELDAAMEEHRTRDDGKDIPL
jgi:hypothetical protein